MGPSVIGGERMQRIKELVPARARRLVIDRRTRPRPPVERDIVGTELSVVGYNHSTADYDDAWLISLIQDSDCFVDVGCNIGFFCLAACVLRADATVLGIDANPECAAVTAGNLTRNGFGTRARAVSSFVSDSAGSVKFHAVGTGAAGSAIEGLSPTAEDVGAAIDVPTSPLDDILARVGMAPDLIKIDVEGAEREVLTGASATVHDSSPRIMVEVHSGGNLSMERNAGDILTWCADNGYTAWYLKESLRLDEPAQVAHRGRCHLLLLPEGQPFPDRLRAIPQSAPIEAALKDAGPPSRTASA